MDGRDPAPMGGTHMPRMPIPAAGWWPAWPGASRFTEDTTQIRIKYQTVGPRGAAAFKPRHCFYGAADRL